MKSDLVEFMWNGEYGVKDLFCGVIAKLGAKGLEGIPQLSLNSEEKAMFEKSAGAVKELVDAMAKLGV